MSDLAGMKERIRIAIAATGMSIADVSRATGVSYPTLMQHLSGKRKPAADQLAKLHDGAGISANYILTGKGHPLHDNKRDAAMTPELQKLSAHKAQMRTELETASARVHEVRSELASAQREAKLASARFEAARTAWIEAAEAHYGVEQ